ncbi:N-formylglutamate amidohydrolase [Roseomonas sp. CCTCC AB2023176]|uniref:N-formylglutamate amidohydrolase n=1 Tax=Roseomonas sp. CCTCC AB2023176 TaxID=3342640 RepID=UPI0035D95579
MDLPPEMPSTREAPFLLSRPARQRAPIVLASPHSGRNYPADFVAESRLDPLTLRRSEDSFVEELFSSGPERGIPLLAATFPRVYLDVNREPWELDPAMFDGPLPDWVNSASPRVGAGLGTIARVVASGEAVYRRRLPFEAAAERVRDLWQPYHEALAGLIRETVEAFGVCLLLDCHSMPSLPGERGPRAVDMILGDAHGTAAAPRATRMVEEGLSDLGYRVRRNDPYAGGYVTRHYGRPRDRVHAVQIEVARGLYMDERHIERLPAAMASLRRDLDTLLERLAASDWSFLRG